MRTTKDNDKDGRPSSITERDDVLELADDPVRRRAWLLFLAQKTLPFDQVIEWARAAEQFIVGLLPQDRSRTDVQLQPRVGSRRGRMKDTVLQLIKDNPAGLSRGEILERLKLKGDKAGETSVSNALIVLLKRGEVVRRERKYFAE